MLPCTVAYYHGFMKHNNLLKNKAVTLRREGKTYNEILAKVPVAKSTLSLWLRNVGLSKLQQQRITKKRIEAQKKGGLARKRERINREKNIIKHAEAIIGSITMRELLLIGTALYWAEGAKSKPHNTSVGLDFGNSDPNMILIHILWLRQILEVNDNDIHLSLYIHKNHEHRLEEIKDFWTKLCGFNRKKISYVYFKKHNPKTARKNLKDDYKGLLRIRVRKSTDLNRKVQGWTLGIVLNYATLT